MKYILVREPFSTNCSGSHQKKSWIPWSSQRMTDCVGTHELIATQPPSRSDKSGSHTYAFLSNYILLLNYCCSSTSMSHLFILWDFIGGGRGHNNLY